MPTEITRCLLAFQNSAANSDFNQDLNFWLVIAGILLIFFCLLSVFLPNVKSLITSPQEFTGLGVTMRVSILTVFVLMGFVLSLSSFALQWQGFKAREIDYLKELRALESAKRSWRSARSGRGGST